MEYQQYTTTSGWTGVAPAGRHEASVQHRAQRGGPGDGVTGVTNGRIDIGNGAACHAERRASASSPGLDPALARAFSAAWAGLWATTGACQQFYRPEFALAHQRDARVARNLAQVEAMFVPTHESADAIGRGGIDAMCRDVNRWLEGLASTGDRGWRFRAARDALSLAGNLSMLAILAACFYRTDGPPDAVVGAAVANTPFGVPWADWTLLAFEGAKGAVTQSLGSPTLIRHHAVDEVLKRMEAGCRLLEACLVSPTPRRSASRPPSAALRSSWRDTLGTLTRARDVATLFTVANTAVPPARLGLWIPSWFSATSAANDGYRGILRVAGLTLDSCRAVTSLLGTWARNEAFTIDAQELTRRWQSLCTRLAQVPEDMRESTMARADRVASLATQCDTALLATIAAHEVLREHLLASCETLSASRIAQACEAFGVRCHRYRDGDREALSASPAESAWGRRWTGCAWESVGTTPLRASYRLLLSYQHWSSALPERLMAAARREDDDGAAAATSTDPAGLARTRDGVVYIELDARRDRGHPSPGQRALPGIVRPS